MWIRIQNQRLKDASIKEYKGRGNSVESYITALTNNTKGG